MTEDSFDNIITAST